MSKYRYREVKNYIHNELKLTKEDIKEIMIPIVKEEVKRVFHNTYGNDVDIERWVRCMVSDEIKRNGDYSMIRNLCREIIKEEIAAAAIPIAGAILGATYGYQNNLKKQRNKIEDAAGDRVAGIIKGKKKKE